MGGPSDDLLRRFDVVNEKVAAALQRGFVEKMEHQIWKTIYGDGRKDPLELPPPPQLGPISVTVDLEQGSYRVRAWRMIGGNKVGHAVAVSSRLGGIATVDIISEAVELVLLRLHNDAVELCKPKWVEFDEPAKPEPEPTLGMDTYRAIAANLRSAAERGDESARELLKKLEGATK